MFLIAAKPHCAFTYGGSLFVYLCVCVRVTTASHSYNSITDHGGELSRLDRWLLSTHLNGKSFLHCQSPERYESIYQFNAPYLGGNNHPYYIIT